MVMGIREKIAGIREDFLREIKSVDDTDSLEKLRIKYLGRKGLAAALFRELSTLPNSEKPRIGGEINSLKNEIEALVAKKSGSFKEKRLSREKLDISLPGIKPGIGHLHPVTQIIDEICAIFGSMGFAVAEGGEIETEFYNFEVLNIPLDHPSRDAFDTFYIDDTFLLRSHTSPVQGRIMQKKKPPFKMLAPGKTYRPDAVDATHSFMFHQIEGFMVDKRITFSDLKGTLESFLKEIFGANIKTRFTPHFFPFTEPSAEVDISCIFCGQKGCRVCSGSGWLEVMGAGMIHPEVFRKVGYKKGAFTGFAFGLGVERIAMLRYGINDIRLFFENDMRFLEQF